MSPWRLAAPATLGAEQAEALVAAVGRRDLRLPPHQAERTAGRVRWSRVTLLCGKAIGQGRRSRAWPRGEAIAAGVTLAREFANRPGNHCTPTYLGEQARKLGKEFGLKVEVLDRKADREARHGLVPRRRAGLGRAAALHRRAATTARAKTQAPVVLVGKGITFDTGGISIKPAAEMDEMKFDMGGAASVLGTLRAVAELKPKLNLVVHRADVREHAERHAPSSRATWSPACRARPSRSSTPTPKAG